MLRLANKILWEAVLKRTLGLISMVMGMSFLGVAFVYAETAAEYIQLGNDSLNQGDFQEAIFDYTKAIDINPNFAKAYDNRGVVYAEQGFLTPAIADFTMAIANDSKDAEAYNNRGHAYAEQGNFDQAISDYTKAIRINALYVKAYDNRAVVFLGLKEYDKAWADVHKVKKIGGVIDIDFIRALEKASARDQ